jgi:hypothetical protein
VGIPRKFRWVFWDVDPRTLDLGRHRDYVLGRVLERGGIDEVRWIIAIYGMAEIHRFLRDRGSPELSRRTIQFWRAVFGAEDEKWAEPAAWRRGTGAPWID